MAKTSGNTVFFALLNLQVSIQEVQSPYPQLAKQADTLYKEYTNIFQPLEGMPPVCEDDFRIDLIDEQASLPPPCHYRLLQLELAEVRKQLTDLLKCGWVRHSCSSYDAPVLFVRKRTSDLCMYGLQDIESSNYIGCICYPTYC